MLYHALRIIAWFCSLMFIFFGIACIFVQNCMSVCLQTTTGSEVRKHQKRNQRPAAAQVTGGRKCGAVAVSCASAAQPAVTRCPFDAPLHCLMSSPRWFSSMNWHKLRVGQLDAPTVKLIRKASRSEAAGRSHVRKRQLCQKMSFQKKKRKGKKKRKKWCISAAC